MNAQDKHNYILGTQFQRTGDSTISVKFDDVIKPTLVGAWGDGEDDTMGNAPKLMVLSPSGLYDYYYYISDATDSNDDPVAGNHWADRDGYVLDEVTINLGIGFWFRSQGGDDVVSVAGQVYGTDTYSIDLAANANKIVSDAYPVNMPLSKLTPSDNLVGEWGDGEDDSMGGAAKLMVLTPSGLYDYYYYISDATDLSDEPIGKNVWADRDGYDMSDVEINTGLGFWVRSPVAGSIEFAR